MANAIVWEGCIGRRIRLRDIHVFFAVAVGVRLLDRSPQGVEPTVYGHALLKCGMAVFDELSQGMRSIEHLDDPTAGEIRIGCQATLAETILPALIEQLSHYPR